MTQPQNRGCAVDNSPQLMAVCAIPDDKKDVQGMLKDEVIVMYTQWAAHRCLMDKLHHPQCKFGIKVAVDIDIKALESLAKDNKYIVRFRTKKHKKINTKLYGQLDILFNSQLKVYAKYNIFRGTQL